MGLLPVFTKESNLMVFDNGQVLLTAVDISKVSHEWRSCDNTPQLSILTTIDLKELFNLDPGSRDILGTAIPKNGKFDIGAIEYTEN